MRTILWTLFISNCLTMILRAVFITVKTYPRTTTHSVGEDVFILLSSAGIIVWVGYWLFIV